MTPEATSQANTRSVRSEPAQWSNCCTVVGITDVLTSAVVIGVVGSTRRGALKAVTADVLSTLSASPSVARTPEEDVMRKPVTAKPAPGDADDERSESDGMSGAMLPKAASRVTRRDTVVKLEHRHGGDEGRHLQRRRCEDR